MILRLLFLFLRLSAELAIPGRGGSMRAARAGSGGRPLQTSQEDVARRLNSNGRTHRTSFVISVTHSAVGFRVDVHRAVILSTSP